MNLLSEVIEFLDLGSENYDHLQDTTWLQNFAFITDLTDYYNIFNIELQKKISDCNFDKYVDEM